MKEVSHSSSGLGATDNRRVPAPEHRPDSNHQDPPHRARTLAIDVGGTGLKASVLDAEGKMVADRVWVDTPYPCPPKVMVKALVALVKPLPAFDRVSVGFPGYVRHDKVLTAPEFGNDSWRGFDLAEALKAKLGKPVRLLNDADMQGFAAIEGKGLELAVTLGTGVGGAAMTVGAASSWVLSASTLPADLRLKIPKTASATVTMTTKATPAKARRGEMGFCSGAVSWL